MYHKLLFLISAIFFFATIDAGAQFNLPGKVRNSLNNKLNQKTDEAVNKGVDKLFEQHKKNKIDSSANKQTSSPGSSQSQNSNTDNNTQAQTKDMKTYSHYDFVPGDTIIFEDNLMDEQSDEFPSKWKSITGKLEVRRVNGENVIAFLEGNAVTISPRMKYDNYLPARYTIEYDFYSTTGGSLSGGFIRFKDLANNKCKEGDGDFVSPVEMTAEGDHMKNCTGKYSDRNGLINHWYHVAISVNERSVKLYINQERVLNCPVSGSTHGITFGTFASAKDIKYMKNLRIASGGNDPYKQITTDGKIICHGIKFDFDKATLKPESMGEINRIYNIMKDHPELKFEIGGHTDTDGEMEHNMKLSESRAESVKNQLVSMGIDASRFTLKGYGPTKPLSDNDSPEGKANNRRVEFVKI